MDGKAEGLINTRDGPRCAKNEIRTPTVAKPQPKLHDTVRFHIPAFNALVATCAGVVYSPTFAPRDAGDGCHAKKGHGPVFSTGASPRNYCRILATDETTQRAAPQARCSCEEARAHSIADRATRMGFNSRPLSDLWLIGEPGSGGCREHHSLSDLAEIAFAGGKDGRKVIHISFPAVHRACL
jgi:hypothetical protein